MTRTRARLAACATLAALGLAAAPAAHAQQTLYVSTNNSTIEKFTTTGGTTTASTYATDTNGVKFLAFGPAAAPEPSQFAAFGVGLLGLGALALKARRHHAA